jgi:Lrp/AsnC family leucine-responsive transcriptional regulator
MEIPKSVSTTFAKLKEESDRCISLKKINGHFYIYAVLSEWNRERKKPVTTTQYIGRITGEGRFVRKMAQTPSTRESGAPLPSNTSRSYRVADGINNALLMALSTNARITLSVLSRKIGLSPATAYHRVKLLERRYGIRYLAEIDVSKLGFLTFIMLVKFADKVPTNREITEFASKEPRIQLVQRTNGKYDMVVHLVAKSNEELSGIRRAFRIHLGGYASSWCVSPSNPYLGFIPIRDELIEYMKDWLLKREYAVLKELNRNGAIKFTEIDEKHGFDEGRSLYTYHKLVEDGVIKRITLTMGDIPMKYAAMMIDSISEYGVFNGIRPATWFDTIEDTNTPTNRYIFACAVEGIGGGFYTFPVYEDSDVAKYFEKFNKMRKGSVEGSIMIITETLVGELCYRKLDPTNTLDYKHLALENKLIPYAPVDYSDTGREKKSRRRIDKSLGAWGFVEHSDGQAASPSPD